MCKKNWITMSFKLKFKLHSHVKPIPWYSLAFQFAIVNNPDKDFLMTVKVKTGQD